MVDYGELLFHRRYKAHHACLDCRRAVKVRCEGLAGAAERPAPLCTACRQPMIDMGIAFKPPRRGQVAKWRRVRMLVEAGFRFHWLDPPRPHTLRETRTFLRDESPEAERARLDRRVTLELVGRLEKLGVLEDFVQARLRPESPPARRRRGTRSR